VVEPSKVFRSGFEKLKQKLLKSRFGIMNGEKVEFGQLVVEMESAKTAVLRKRLKKGG
jgi:hypothetical protein